jgi:FAD/FMN-containing dehydrogenase
VAQTAKQISAAVTFASKHNLAVQPRSGGHSYASHSLGGTDGALVIDLSLMNDVKVHPEADPEALWRAEIGGGTRLGKITEELYRQGKRAIGPLHFLSEGQRRLTMSITSTRYLS